MNKVPTRDGKRLTIVVPSPAMLDEIEYDGSVVKITAEIAHYHADRCSDDGVDPRTLPLMEQMFFTGERIRDHADNPPPARKWSAWPKTPATRHLFGLIEMSLKVGDLLPLVWVNPEQHLHPAQACELGDVLLALTDVKSEASDE